MRLTVSRHIGPMFSVDDLSVFQLLDRRIDMLTQRQKSVAENIANANTPGYVPRDVDMSSFQRVLGRHTSPSVGSVGLSRTNEGHIEGKMTKTSDVKFSKSPDSETTLDGNAVVLEEQMLRMNEVRADYDTALSLYQKGLALLRLSARAPGG